MVRRTAKEVLSVAAKSLEELWCQRRRRYTGIKYYIDLRFTRSEKRFPLMVVGSKTAARRPRDELAKDNNNTYNIIIYYVRACIAKASVTGDLFVYKYNNVMCVYRIEENSYTRFIIYPNHPDIFWTFQFCDPAHIILYIDIAQEFTRSRYMIILLW